VLHLAAYYDVGGEPNPLYEEVTAQGTRRLIDALQEFEVQQFVFASTMLVHRPTERPDERIDESSSVEASWVYPASKVRTEHLLLERRGAIPLVRLRIAGVYDDLDHSPFIAAQIARIYEHRLVTHLSPACCARGSPFCMSMTWRRRWRAWSTGASNCRTRWRWWSERLASGGAGGLSAALHRRRARRLRLCVVQALSPARGLRAG
tara:strand:+ start:7035 stop:7652 length:618 start_codon:yes stop_codon:yes gene_type:complete